jgi:hypothetical protein
MRVAPALATQIRTTPETWSPLSRSPSSRNPARRQGRFRAHQDAERGPAQRAQCHELQPPWQRGGAQSHRGAHREQRRAQERAPGRGDTERHHHDCRDHDCQGEPLQARRHRAHPPAQHDVPGPPGGRGQREADPEQVQTPVQERSAGTGQHHGGGDRPDGDRSGRAQAGNRCLARAAPIWTEDTASSTSATGRVDSVRGATDRARARV